MDKACIDGDSEELDEEQTFRFRSSVLESRKRDTDTEEESR